MILLIIGILLFLLLIYLLFSPIVCVIDTNNNLYYISISGILKGQITEVNRKWKIRFRFFFIPFTLNLSGKRKFKRKKKVKKKNKNKTIKQNPLKYRHLFKKVMKLISVKRLVANIDTDDYPLNAKLIALTPLINKGNISVNINFNNENSIDFKAITYLYRLIGIAISIYITNKK